MTIQNHPESRPTPTHCPVMLAEVLEWLQPAPGDSALDVTTGTGGHALALAQAIGAEGRLLGLDADAGALSQARARLDAEAPCPVVLEQTRFSRAAHAARAHGFDGFDVILADLGIGTHQLKQTERGFSFDSEARLDMRFDTSVGLSAWDLVNEWPEENLSDIFHRLGEERYSRQIASRICRCRSEEPIDTPAALATLIKGVVARRSRRGVSWRIHPATRVFMALRITVNGELDELGALLAAVPALLKRSGRICILSYHSLEARIVKHTWREQASQGLMELTTRRVVKPSDEEVAQNPKARSAQLRAALRTAQPLAGGRRS
jgi:16S rRNA (cytosine1402-N4)-methyltransferase